MNVQKNTNTELLNSYRSENQLKADKIRSLNCKIKQLNELVEQQELLIEEKEKLCKYWEVKYNRTKLSSWFFNYGPEPEPPI